MKAKAEQKPTKHSSKEDAANLLSLPVELHVQILLALQCRDFCSFRAVSTRARDLLSEGEIIRQWIIQKADRQHLKLYPPGRETTFQYLHDEQSRLRTATGFATLLAEYIGKKILRYSLLRREEYPFRRIDFLETVTSQLKEKMIPLIVTVQHYLEQSACILLDAGSSSDEDDDYHTSYRSRERQIFESYEPAHLHLAHKFWMFLIWLSDQILHPPSYAGTVERTVRGWSTEPLNRFDYRLFLVFGNIEALIPLVRAGTPKQSRKVMDSWLSQLNPDRNILWHQGWHKVPAVCGKQVTKEQVKRVLGLELSATDLWVESATAVLVAKDEILPQDNNPIGTPCK